MRVLFLTGYVYEPTHDKYIRCKGGINLYVREIAYLMQKSVDLHVLTYGFGSEETIDRIHYIRHRIIDSVLGLHVKRIKKSAHMFFHTKASFAIKAKLAFRQLDYGYIERAIKDLKPDIVHIHGLMDGIMDHIDVCQKYSIPVIVTLHGLLGFGGAVDPDKKYYNMEKALFQRAEQQGISITVVSSGIKKRAVEGYNLSNPSNIHVIVNGIRLLQSEKSDHADINDKGLTLDKQVIINIGSLSRRKNQISIIRAWSLLDPSITEKFQLVFVGKELDSVDEIMSEARLSPYTAGIHFCGFLSPEDTRTLLEKSCLNISASLDEGFGLTIIEAMSCGVPTLMYSDLDAFNDIYNEKSILGISDRSVQGLADGIQKALAINWNREEIIQSASGFKLDCIIDKYKSMYQKVIKGYESKL